MIGSKISVACRDCEQNADDFWGRCSVRVGYCVLKFDVDIGVGRGIVRVYGRVNKVVAIE